MMTQLDSMIDELENEAKATRRLLEAIPADKLGWKPHPKSMTLGRLAEHIATVSTFMCQVATLDVWDFPETFDVPPSMTKAEILKAFEEGLVTSKETLKTLAGREFSAWSLKKQGEILMSMPRLNMLRMMVYSHTYHHRGQLSVYLRLLDVPVPSTYGPTADANPFG